MAQAATSPITRRSLFAGAATVAIAATPVAAFAAAPGADAAILALATRIEGVAAREEAAYLHFDRARQAMEAWIERNPKPVMRECKVGTNAEYEIWQTEWSTTVDKSKVRAFDPNGDMKAAIKEHGAALTAWGQRRKRAERTVTLDARQKRAHALTDELDALCKEMTELPASTLGGLRRKAKMAVYNEDVAHAIVDDLLTMGV